MHRALPLSLLVVLGLVAPALPASADFHPACIGFADAYANVELAATLPGTFTYVGIVNCPGANVTITSLTLTRVGTGVVSSTSQACGTLTAPCIATNNAPQGAAGTYRVDMTFNVNNGAFIPTRHQVWNWLGVGEPVLTCIGVGFFPIYVPSGC
jgi:hypothetical protein